MSNNGTIAINDRSSKFDDYSGDPASGGFFHSDFKKHDDLRMMLDSSKDNLKLEAMKRIIGMVAKGRDASMLFPAVVKNVVSKNIEIKKLVYVYLERYAEEQQDLALLSISTFQRALKEPNPLIRAGALRVLSSIRVKMISPIVMLAIKEASSDMSSYVRKTAAHAIPKLYSIDPESKNELVTIIHKLLADKTVLVIGSAVMAFTEVCPERTDLIHTVYRKLCALIVDVDEWGQVTIVNMLTRYARMHFSDPNIEVHNEGDNHSANDSQSDYSDKPMTAPLDPDHRLLLRSTRPLLQSRNAAVVMAVAQLYHHGAPKSETILAAKALVRLLRSHMEVQTVVLSTIASISVKNKNMFEPYLKSFFVRTSDPTNIKLLKLEILTNLATDSNVSTILREIQTYITHTDMQFVSATIQAIGRCACSITEVTDSCLNGLVLLLSNKDEAIVAESVVVIKRLLQTQAADPKEIITHMSRLLDNITVSQARAAIIWLLGEHSQKVPNLTPDILRKLAKGFADEHDIVKLQIMNLAVKLFITNPDQTSKLCHYIFSLARYDQNYDIRDKARMLKLCLPGQNALSRFSERIFLANKPAPLLQSQFKDFESFQLGSLSHYIKLRASGYEDLPDFPENPPPGDCRNTDPAYSDSDVKFYKSKKGKVLFNWELDGGSGSPRGGSITTSEESASSSGSSSGSDDSSGSEDDDDEDDEVEEEEQTDKSESEKKSKSEESEYSTYSSSEESESEQEQKVEEVLKPQKPVIKNKRPQEPIKSNLDLLLDLKEMDDSSAPILAFTNPNLNRESDERKPLIQDTQPVFLNTKPLELLNRINGRGLSINYRYTRIPNMLSPKMITINLMFTNTTADEITNIKLQKSNEPSDIVLQEFSPLTSLLPNCTLSAPLYVNFCDSTKPCNFEIVSSLGTFKVSIKPSIGELMKPVTMPFNLFKEQEAKLQGMNVYSKTLPPLLNVDVFDKVTEAANLGSCPSEDDCLRFAGKSLASGSLVLVTTRSNASNLTLTVKCENPIFGSVLLNELLSYVKSFN